MGASKRTSDDKSSSGVFEWQLSDGKNAKRYKDFRYDVERYWGGFPKTVPDGNVLPSWALGPFVKYSGNPVLAPSPDGWDVGKPGGGVRNGSILHRNGKFHYIYRCDLPRSPVGYDEWLGGAFDYVCDIGLATSDDGIHFKKDQAHSPFFRKGEDERFSFEDVCLVENEGEYYLFCNRWDFTRAKDPTCNGVFLATSKDMLNWHKVGLIFPGAQTIHRNPCILQNPRNQAVRIDGRFVMYLNHHLIAYSTDLIHWKAEQVQESHLWPGGEGCFALCDYLDGDPDAVLLFTGGHHSGHFYAIGEVLFSKKDVTKPIEWLPRPLLTADPAIPWEDGRAVLPPHEEVSYFRDAVFFTGLTLHDGKWLMYYSGSDYYTCLAQANMLLAKSSDSNKAEKEKLI